MPHPSRSPSRFRVTAVIAPALAQGTGAAAGSSRGIGRRPGFLIIRTPARPNRVWELQDALDPSSNEATSIDSD